MITGKTLVTWAVGPPPVQSLVLAAFLFQLLVPKLFFMTLVSRRRTLQLAMASFLPPPFCCRPSFSTKGLSQGPSGCAPGLGSGSTLASLAPLFLPSFGGPPCGVGSQCAMVFSPRSRAPGWQREFICSEEQGPFHIWHQSIARSRRVVPIHLDPGTLAVEPAWPGGTPALVPASSVCLDCVLNPSESHSVP